MFVFMKNLEKGKKKKRPRNTYKGGGRDALTENITIKFNNAIEKLSCC
jgi:hypothetical protein